MTQYIPYMNDIVKGTAKEIINPTLVGWNELR